MKYLLASLMLISVGLSQERYYLFTNTLTHEWEVSVLRPAFYGDTMKVVHFMTEPIFKGDSTQCFHYADSLWTLQARKAVERERQYAVRRSWRRIR